MISFGQFGNTPLLCSPPSQSVLPWADCPVNSNRTGPIEECERATPTQYFFFRETLDISSSIEENGGIHTGQALCLLLAWVITYLFIVRGVKSTGKVRESPHCRYCEHTHWQVVLIVHLVCQKQLTKRAMPCMIWACSDPIFEAADSF